RQGAEKLVDHRPKRLVSRLALDPDEEPSRDLNARAKLLDEPRLSASMRAGDDERLRLGGVPFDRFERGRDPRELRVAEEERPRREPARAGSRGRGDRAHGILAERLGERAQRFPSASEPIIRPLLEQAMDERDERLRKIRPKRRERRRRRLEVLLEKDASIARIERRPSREEDVEDHSERVEVASSVGGLSADALGRDVPESAEDLVPGGVLAADQTEIDQLDRADVAVDHRVETSEVSLRRSLIGVLRDEEVRRLEVVVQDPVAVDEIERAQDLHRDLEERLRARVPRDARELFAAHELRRE